VFLHEAAANGAVCIDGSPGAYYIRTANANGVPSDPNKWVIFMEGGGWTSSDVASVSRAKTHLGSSKNYPVEASAMEGTGLFASAPFDTHTIVYAKYCDGGSWTGALSNPPKVVGNTTIYYRGRGLFDGCDFNLEWCDILTFPQDSGHLFWLASTNPASSPSPSSTSLASSPHMRFAGRGAPRRPRTDSDNERDIGWKPRFAGYRLFDDLLVNKGLHKASAFASSSWPKFCGFVLFVCLLLLLLCELLLILDVNCSLRWSRCNQPKFRGLWYICGKSS
jgi:hypothetical protein